MKTLPLSLLSLLRHQNFVSITSVSIKRVSIKHVSIKQVSTKQVLTKRVLIKRVIIKRVSIKCVSITCFWKKGALKNKWKRLKFRVLRKSLPSKKKSLTLWFRNLIERSQFFFLFWIQAPIRGLFPRSDGFPFHYFAYFFFTLTGAPVHCAASEAWQAGARHGN